MKENNELKGMMMEQNNKMMEQQNIVLEIAKNGTHNTTTNNTNSHNKAFNLQFFLNETCKDAMNITDFVESIQYQLSDLEKMGEIGYVEGITNIIVKNLNALDVTQRPLHCTDKKRETIYIKDEDKWEKDEDKNKIRKAIKKVANKNARLIQKFKEKHPDYNEYHSKYSTQYHKLIIESFGGSGDNDLEKEDKIICNIAKSIVVEK
jgi:Txe/YoeB family toxin of Txe-Axe toxin-antitoxin module